MKITIELPDSPFLESAISFDARNSGYRSVEEWAANALVGMLESMEQPAVTRICERWSENLRKHEEAA